MKLSFLFTLFIVFLFSSQFLLVSCHTKEAGEIPPITKPNPEPEPSPVTEPCNLIKETLLPNSSSAVTTFEYNTEGLVHKITRITAVTSYYETYEYDQNKRLINTALYASGSTVAAYRIKHVYNEKGQWISSTPLAGAPNVARLLDVTYDSNGYRTKIDFNSLDGTRRTSNFKYENGNLIESSYIIPYSTPSDMDEYYLYEYYSDKENKLKAWKDRLAPVFYEETPSNNLLKKWTRVGYGSVEYSYEFNTEGYPTKMFSQTTGTTNINLNFVYEYDCK